MVTFIEIVLGANEGSRIQVAEGMTLGRTKADILIKDPKVSSTHAQVVLDGKGQLVLVDMDSSNGININGRRVKKVSLLSGVSFEVGNTQFRVVLLEEEKAINFGRVVTWRSILRSDVPADQMKNKNPPTKPERFSPAVKLTFLQGIQSDEEIILGYGPRRAGADSLDIELLDQEAPKEAFELRPGGPGIVQLVVKAAGQISLNDKIVDAEMLKDGDLISFGDTLIQVSYL